MDDNYLFIMNDYRIFNKNLNKILNDSDILLLFDNVNNSKTKFGELFGYSESSARRITNKIFNAYNIDIKNTNIDITKLRYEDVLCKANKSKSITEFGYLLGATNNNTAFVIGKKALKYFNIENDVFNKTITNYELYITKNEVCRLLNESITYSELGNKLSEYLNCHYNSPIDLAHRILNYYHIDSKRLNQNIALRFSKEEINEIYNQSMTKSDFIKNLGYSRYSKKKLEQIIDLYNLPDKFSVLSDKEIFDDNIAYSKKHRKLLIEERGYRCEQCGLSKWQGYNIPLEIHHIDGNSYNNKKDNLRILCRNCHSQTETYRNKRNEITSQSKYSDDEIAQALEHSDSIYGAINILNIRAGKHIYHRIYNIIRSRKIEPFFSNLD